MRTSRILAAIAAFVLPLTPLCLPAAGGQPAYDRRRVPGRRHRRGLPRSGRLPEVNGTWYAYSTNNGRGHVPVASAPSASGPWTIRGDAMPGGPSASWAQSGRTWAPDVHPNPDGSFTLTYTAWHKVSGRQCIGVATASSALGPFTPVGTPAADLPARPGRRDRREHLRRERRHPVPDLEERRQRDRPAVDALADPDDEQRHEPHRRQHGDAHLEQRDRGAGPRPAGEPVRALLLRRRLHRLQLPHVVRDRAEPQRPVDHRVPPADDHGQLRQPCLRPGWRGLRR